jgi:hypothetical protein
MVPNQAEVFAQAVDFYLSEQGAKHLPEIHRVANLPESDESDALLLGYAMEGVRLAGTFGSYREAAVADTIKEDDGREVAVKRGDRVFVSFVSDPPISLVFSLIASSCFLQFSWIYILIMHEYRSQQPGIRHNSRNRRLSTRVALWTATSTTAPVRTRVLAVRRARLR